MSDTKSTPQTIYEESLKYHSSGRKGKIEVVPSKPVASQHELSLAYSPGVAEPCRIIAEKEDTIYEYTAKGNLVAVVSNGTAVLGLGNIGAAASKPVMEGKGVLFKKFADIDVFDIELNAPNPDDVIRACEMLEPTFGGINLEDIKAPECFYIEEELKKRLNIPVFHDDQHGTAVISAAAFLNALEVTGKNIKEVRVVVGGGGAAAIACASLYLSLGVKPENLCMFDSVGVIYKGRTERMNPYKERFAIETDKRSVADAMKDADAFVGASAKGVIDQKMVASMAKDPIIFAMANPDPEIMPDEVLEVRQDAIMATGRSDYPNQVNNVLGFPFIFRGALDTRAKGINEEMKMAAVRALAALAKEDIPEAVRRAYEGQDFSYGRDYLIPKPFDRRALLWVATAVAEASMKTGMARQDIDLVKYREHLETLLGQSYTVMRGIKNRVKDRVSGKATKPAKIVFPEGSSPKILRAAQTVIEESIAQPILLGYYEDIQKAIRDNGLEDDLKGVEVIQPSRHPKLMEYAQKYFEKRQRKGATLEVAQARMRHPNFFASMMVEMGDADGLVGGVSQSYPEMISPAIKVVGTKPGMRLAGVYMVITKKKTYWFTDTSVNIDPTAEQLCDIAIETAKLVESFTNMRPKVALLSFSNFGSNQHPNATKMRHAVELIRKRDPGLCVDGEMQADTAVDPQISEEHFPFNAVPGDADVLVFPDLQSSNVAYKLMAQIGGAETIGPILLGMNKPVSVLQRGADVNSIVNMVAITAMEYSFRGGA